MNPNRNSPAVEGRQVIVVMVGDTVRAAFTTLNEALDYARDNTIAPDISEGVTIKRKAAFFHDIA
jgi:hypothetical protein